MEKENFCATAETIKISDGKLTERRKKALHAKPEEERTADSAEVFGL